MTRVLLTGMSGTGKSTVVRLLRERGLRAIDTDEGWVDVLPDGTQRWRADDIRRFLAEDRGGVLFVAGCEENMVGLLADFDLVILLSAPLAVLRQRLATRTTNDFGRDPEELHRVLADLEEVEPRLRAMADHEIETTATVEETVAAILHACVPGAPDG